MNWDRSSTLSLCSLYESNMHKIDHQNKKTHIWNILSDNLKTVFGVDVSDWLLFLNFS